MNYAHCFYSNRAPPPVVDPFSLDLALFWETPNGQRTCSIRLIFATHPHLDAGVQHIHGIAPLAAAERSEDHDVVQQGQPVRFLLQFPPRVHHNFVSNKCVPLE